MDYNYNVFIDEYVVVVVVVVAVVVVVVVVMAILLQKNFRCCGWHTYAILQQW